MHQRQANPAERARQTTQALRGVERAVALGLPSLADIVFLGVFLGVLLSLQGQMLGYDGDAAWNIRIGLHILDHGIPRTEFLLATQLGQPHIYYEWLGQAIYGLAYRVGGLNGVITLAALLIALVAVGLLGAVRRRGVPLLPALAIALVGTLLTTITWTARDQLFSLVLTLWWSEWIWRYWRDGAVRRLWLLPPVMVLWANLHGGFISGILLLTVATAVAWLFPAGRGRANVRHLTLTLAATLVATLATPWGLALHAHIFDFFANPLISRYTAEFQSPNFHTLIAQAFLALVCVLVAAWLWLGWSHGAQRGGGSVTVWRPEPLAVAQVSIWTLLACLSVRYIPLWALLATPALGETLLALTRAGQAAPVDAAATDGGLRYVTDALRRRALAAGAVTARLSRRLADVDRQVGSGIWATLVLVLLLATAHNGGMLPGSATHVLDAQFDAQVFPVRAAEALHTQGLPPGRGFTTYQWGSYLDYALPEYHVFIDSRSDVYSQQFLSDYITIIGLGHGWQALWQRDAIAWALLPIDAPLTQVLALRPDWRCTAIGGDGVATLCAQQRGLSRAAPIGYAAAPPARIPTH